MEKFHIQSDLHLIYKQNFYNDKQKEINEFFGKYHFPLIDYLDHPALIEEWKQNIDAAAYEKYLNRDLKLPSKEKVDRHDNIDYCPTIIKESLNWVYVLDIMEYNAYRINN